MQWSIQQVARLAGTTSRTLRHYDDIGLLTPTTVGANGYRYYDEHALVRLQRILLLRAMGLGLSDIGQVLASERDEVAALTGHLERLRAERELVDRRIAAVEHTIVRLTQGGELMAENMFDGFNHESHRDEVVERWGPDAYAESDAWWRGMSQEERGEWKAISDQLAHDWSAAAADPGVRPESPVAQRIARRHVAWVAGIPGTPASDPDADVEGYVRGLADMYVADERFSANYGGVDGARFVRDGLLVALAERAEGGRSAAEST